MSLRVHIIHEDINGMAFITFVQFWVNEFKRNDNLIFTSFYLNFMISTIGAKYTSALNVKIDVLLHAPWKEVLNTNHLLQNLETYDW